MKKLLVCILIFALSIVTFVACDTKDSSDPALQTIEPVIDPNPQPSPNPDPQPVELDDVSLPSGNYVGNDIVYCFNKDTKSLIVEQYYYYNDYIIHRPAELYNGKVVYINNIYAGDSVYFKNKNTNEDCYLSLKNEKPTVTIVAGSTYRSLTLRELASTIIEAEDGTYVSGKQEQTVNEVKEEFYLFFVLTDTTASIYVSNNNTTYSGEPLHTVGNYEELFVSGYLRIKIPHENGSYNCSVTFKGDEVTFVNSYETKGDYSCSGTLTKIA